MNKADPLIAAFRQLAVGKVASRLGGQNATIAKDGKDKAEHFREQLRSIAQGAKPEPKAEIKRAETDVPQDLEVPDRIAEVIEEVTSRPKERGSPPNDDIAAAGRRRSDAIAAGMAWSGSSSQRRDIPARSGSEALRA